jgi:hypothetical protein
MEIFFTYPTFSETQLGRKKTAGSIYATDTTRGQKISLHDENFVINLTAVVDFITGIRCRAIISFQSYKNCGCHKYNDHHGGERVATRWLITQDTHLLQHGIEKLVPENELWSGLYGNAAN